MLLNKPENQNIIMERSEESRVSRDFEIRRICSYLQLPYSPALIREFSGTEFTGRFGDPTGVKKYSNISSSPVAGWRKVLSNGFRIRWAKRYLSWIGSERMSAIGYEMQELMNELNSLPELNKIGISDMIWALYGNATCYLESSLFKQKMNRISKWRTVYKHS